MGIFYCTAYLHSISGIGRQDSPTQTVLTVDCGKENNTKRKKKHIPTNEMIVWLASFFVSASKFLKLCLLQTGTGPHAHSVPVWY